MKINPSFIKQQDKLKTKKTQTGGTARSGFASLFEDKYVVEYENSVEELFNDLEEKQKNLVDRQSMSDLAEFKKTVEALLKLVSEEGFETKTYQRRRSDGRADFFIVKKINETLKRLTMAMTSPENKAFKILKECEEIRGLLFDLLH